jgi:integrase
MRRPVGTGSIFRHNNSTSKTWFIAYTAKDGRRRENSHSEDLEVAKQLLAKRLGEIATGQGLPPAKVTVGTLIDLVTADYDFRKHKSGKITAWRAAKHFEDLRKIPAMTFGTVDIQRYVAERRKEASDATINRELSILRRGFVLGKQSDPPLVYRSPYIPQLAEDNVRQGFLEPEQYERLLAELPERLKALFVCAYHVGTRKGELRKIRWEQVDFEAGLIRLEARQTKGKAPRTLPIYGDMERWLRTQQETGISGCSWVFHWRGQPVGAHLDGWHEACERAGVPGLLFHDLRRAAVRNMKRAGIQDKVAMAISGHKTRSVFDRYNIVDEADLTNAGELLEQYAERRKRERAAKLKRVK